jgi:hypothetical protein
MSLRLRGDSSEPFGDPLDFGVQQKFAKLALRRTDPKEVTQMVTDGKKDIAKRPVKQGEEGATPEPNKTGLHAL